MRDRLRKLRYRVLSLRVLPRRLVLLQHPLGTPVLAQSLHQAGLGLPIFVLLIQKRVKLFLRPTPQPYALEATAKMSKKCYKAVLQIAAADAVRK